MTADGPFNVVVVGVGADFRPLTIRPPVTIVPAPEMM
jgi:hypothetical protein